MIAIGRPRTPQSPPSARPISPLLPMVVWRRLRPMLHPWLPVWRLAEHHAAWSVRCRAGYIVPQGTEVARPCQAHGLEWVLILEIGFERQ